MKRAVLGVVFVLAACGEQTSAPPAYGEALVIVDTDLAVPAIANRLRVDVYDEDGVWTESRDIGRSDPRDWPASFSVYSDDDTRPRRALVRLRAYPEGVTRGYQGERFASRGDFHEPPFARSLAELCANAPELPMGGRVTARSSVDAITDPVAAGRCQPPTRSGSVAARVTIATAGAYRFSVANALPYGTRPTLFLRSQCDNPASQLACDFQPTAGFPTSGHLPRFDVTLQPGTYWLLTGGEVPGWNADLTLEVEPVDAPLPPQPPVVATAPDPRPRFVRDGIDATPAEEPLPSATIERLVAVTLVPGARGSVHVVLRGQCIGTQAKLGDDAHVPDLATAETCLDTEGVRARVADSQLQPDLTRPTTSLQGTFATAEACAASPPDAKAVCVPGGLFLFGSRLDEPFVATRHASTPERLAIVHRFWMDRREVTVADVRSAIADGLAYDKNGFSFFLHDDSTSTDLPQHWCTITPDAGALEDRAASCVSWSFARSYCIARGGDLPTEVQWEYAATAAGRPFKTAYPWGADDPSCDRSVFGRAPPNVDWGSLECSGAPPGPQPAGSTLGDANPLGIVDLEGGVSEWMRDSASAFDGPCWSAAPLEDPMCWEENAPFRSLRGAAWALDSNLPFVRSAGPGEQPAGDPRGQYPADPTVGFRCVYPRPL